MRSSILLKTKEHLGTPDWSCRGGKAAIFGEEQDATPSVLLQSWAGLAAKRVRWRTVLLAAAPKAHSQKEPKSLCPEASDFTSSTVFASQRPLDLEDLRVPKKTYLDTMRKRLGGCWLAIVCVLLFSQVAAVRARGIKHRIKWNRKALPSSSSPVTEAQKMDVQRHPGAFIKQGRKLDIDFGPEGNRYYEANYWQFPDGIHYNGCSEANVTKEKFVTNCINTTQAANQEELFQEKQGKLHQRILWRLIRELCSAKHCDFWLEKGAGLQVTMDQSVMLCLLIFIWFIVK